LDTQVDELIDLVARLSGHDRTTVALTSRVRDDLGIDGDDADELFQAISARWNVDWTGFEFQQYFVEEPSVARALCCRSQAGANRGYARPSRSLTWQLSCTWDVGSGRPGVPSNCSGRREVGSSSAPHVFAELPARYLGYAAQPAR
jgi:Protein of unknown function (DUF1493)